MPVTCLGERTFLFLRFSTPNFLLQHFDGGIEELKLENICSLLHWREGEKMQYPSPTIPPRPHTHTPSLGLSVFPSCLCSEWAQWILRGKKLRRSDGLFVWEKARCPGMIRLKQTQCAGARDLPPLVPPRSAHTLTHTTFPLSVNDLLMASRLFDKASSWIPRCLNRSTPARIATGGCFQSLGFPPPPPHTQTVLLSSSNNWFPKVSSKAMQ